MRRPENIDDPGGSPVHVEKGRVLRLSDPARAWVIRAGTGEVRCRRMSGEHPAATHRFLGWVTPGDVLLALSGGSHDARRDLSVHAIEQLIVSVVPLGAVRHLPAAAGMTDVELIERWLAKLAGFLPSTGPTPAGEKLPREGATDVDPGQVLVPSGHGVSWIRIESGSACLMGIQDLPIEASPLWIPICRELRIEVRDRMTLHVAEGSDLDKGVPLVQGLRAIHTLCDSYLDLLDLQEYRGEVDRLQRRRALHERDARAAMSALQSVLDPAAAVTERDSPLLTAANLVGQAIGVEVRPPPKWEERDRLTDPVEAIARASGLRHRGVLLRGTWWKSDAGPLLAFRTVERQPVALLPRRSGYDLVDPLNRTRAPVNAGIAASLEPEAAMLYRPYPDETVRPKQLLPFLLRGRGRDLLFVLSLAVLAALAGMLTPIATALLMDEAIPAANTRLATELGLALLAAAVGILIFGFAQGIVSTRMSVAVESTVLSGLWDRLLKVRVPFFGRFSSGDLLARASALSEASREINGATVQSILAALTALLYLGLLALLNLRLAMMAAGLAAVAGVVTGIGAAFLRRHLERMLELEGAVFGSAVQMINAVSKIRVAGAQRRAFSRWAERYARQLRHLDRVQFTEDLVAVFTQAIPVVGIVILFWMGAKLLVDRQGQPAEHGMSVGTFLAFQTAMTVFFLGVHALCLRSMAILRTGAKVKRTRAVLAATMETSATRVDPGRLRGGLCLSHVAFRYRAQGRKILDDVNIRVDPSEFVALVGPSGSGKSTIFRLILGFETPESGSVAFDGKDLRTLDVVGVRRQLGVVLQAGQVTAGSLLQNICPGGRITLDEAWEAAEDAGLADDIRAMPMGLHTLVSEGGRNLSGGQRQRLLIARALVTRPRILLMDEATSALDNATQAIVAASLDRRKVSRLVIAHRLSTVRQASRVYVLDQGRVVEEGNFEELLREQGLFAAMMERHVA